MRRKDLSPLLLACHSFCGPKLHVFNFVDRGVHEESLLGVVTPLFSWYPMVYSLSLHTARMHHTLALPNHTHFVPWGKM